MLLVFLAAAMAFSGCGQKKAQENDFGPQAAAGAAEIKEVSGIPSEQELGIEDSGEEAYIDSLEESGIDDLQLGDIEGLLTLEN